MSEATKQPIRNQQSESAQRETARQIADLLREAVTVLDEPFHRKAVASTLESAADLIASLTADLAQARLGMAQQLDEALHDVVIARPESPEVVWRMLLDEARARATDSRYVDTLVEQVRQARQNETEMAQRLSTILSGGAASEWDHIVDAAESLRRQLAEAKQARDEALHALEAANQFIHPDVSRGPAVNGWQNTVDLVDAVLRQRAQPVAQTEETR